MDKRCRLDEPGAGPSHAPPAGARGEFEDIRHYLEAVLQGVPEVMCSHIQDDRVLNQCVGIPAEWRIVICRAAIAGDSITR